MTNQNPNDPYAEFSAIYDAWQALHPRPFSVAMTLRMYQALDEWGVPDDSLLDLSCGSGTLAHWWAERHPDWRIVGVDPSAAMIEKAQAGAPQGTSLDAGSDTSPRFIHEHPAQLELNESFGMVTCFFDSLNHVVRQAELLSILKQARHHLAPNGLFLFDLIDEDSFEDTFSSPWIVQNDDLFVATESEFFERKGVEYGRIDFTCFEKLADEWKRRRFSITERCWRREEFDPLLEEAGLENIHVQLIDPDDQPDVFVSRRLYVCRPRA